MNTKVLIGIIVAIILIGGALLLSNQGTNTQNLKSPTELSKNPSPTQEPQIKTTTVTISDTGFLPQTVTIKAGEKVVWTNKSGSLATVYSDPHPAHTNYPSLNLGSVVTNGSTMLVFPKAGTYTYHDHLHPERKGTIVVL